MASQWRRRPGRHAAQSPVTLDPRQPVTQAAVLLALAVPQLYLLPRGIPDISTATIATAALAALLLIGTGRRLLRGLLTIRVYQVLLALLAIRFVAVLWSPDRAAGLPPIVLLGQFLITLVVMAGAASTGVDFSDILRYAYWPLVALEAALVVCFRLLPAVEHAYLRAIGGFFAGHNTVSALFGSQPNNVLDPAKAGGVFINANVAALFLGFNALAAFALSTRTRDRWTRGIGVIALVGVLFTGSKSATMLAVALPALALGGLRLTRGGLDRRVRRQLLLTGGAGAVLAAAAAVIAPRIPAAIWKSFAGRTEIWTFGIQSFRDHPVLGLGYGGWEAGFPSFAIRHKLDQTDFPPHNVLLAAWSTTGLLGLAVTIAFYGLLGYLVYRRLSNATAEERPQLAWIGAAMAWMVIQSMGENEDVFGEIHLIPMLAILIICLVRPLGGETNERVAEPYRRYRPAPAVPAFGDLHRQPGGGPENVPAPVRSAGSGAAAPWS